MIHAQHYPPQHVLCFASSSQLNKEFCRKHEPYFSWNSRIYTEMLVAH